MTLVCRSPCPSTAISNATTPSDIAQMGSIMPAFFDLTCHAQTVVKTTMSAIKAITATMSGGIKSSMSIFFALNIGWHRLVERLGLVTHAAIWRMRKREGIGSGNTKTSTFGTNVSVGHSRG